MFVHSVYFWLQPAIGDDDHAAFVRGLKSLLAIESVRHGWIGVPADTNRPVIERGYSYALTVVFADRAGHDIYQDHPIHLAFVAACQRFWRQVRIYDAVDKPQF